MTICDALQHTATHSLEHTYVMIGVAALNIGGTTVHEFAGLGRANQTPQVRTVLQGVCCRLCVAMCCSVLMDAPIRLPRVRNVLQSVCCSVCVAVCVLQGITWCRECSGVL